MKKSDEMTSEFDTLSGIGQLAEKNAKYKPLALSVANLARAEIEALLKISYNDWDLKWLYEKDESEFAIFSWLGYIHSQYDHSEKWHGRLISWDLQRLNDAVCSIEQGHKPYGLEEVLSKYPEILNLLVELGSIKVGWAKSRHSRKIHYCIDDVSVCRYHRYCAEKVPSPSNKDQCRLCQKEVLRSRGEKE